MTAHAPIAGETLRSSAWRRHLAALAVGAGAILALFHRDVFDMARIWAQSATFNHCALVPLIVGWLIWQRRAELGALRPVSWRPGLLLVAVGALIWLGRPLADIALAGHLGLVVMLQGAAIACLGKAVARALAFPLCYALFIVPVGQFLVPPLQHVTAEISMMLLGIAGIPAHIEGIFITTPGGYFEVAEACSGVKFLIAMIALGALAAHLGFASPRRRVAFLAAAVLVPIFANGARAFATIALAQTHGIGFAVGVDHIVYGWLFFALVIALLLGASWPFFDRDPDAAPFDPARLQPVPPAPEPPMRLAATAGLATLLALFAMLAAALLHARMPIAGASPGTIAEILAESGARLE
ncbi:MAG: exosortase A [Sphingomonadaceae bacterium]